MSTHSTTGALANRRVQPESTAVAAVRRALNSLAAQDRVSVSDPGLEPTLDPSGDASGSPTAAPRRFGDYELIEEISRGGMGVVFKARHLKLNRCVALKMILAGEWASADEVLRFHIEIEAAAQLRHPNIVPVYEVGQVEGRHFFTMPLIEGRSLAASMADGPFEPCRAARLLESVAQAVQHAHDHGVIHRDLKPGNILLDGDGRPHLTDFGVARLTYEQSHLTGVGQVLGTPHYMSPEQAAGEVDTIGPASDIYSLGAALYAMLTGRSPPDCRQGDVRVATLQAPPPGRFQSCVPADLKSICLKCLAQDPRARYASAAELAADLSRFLAHLPIRARPAGWTARAVKGVQRQPALAAVIAVAASVIMLSLSGAVWQWRRAEAARADAVEQLREAYFAQAQADRWSGRPGRRFSSWEALRKAARIRSSVALRNEAIACLTLCDVEVERRLPGDDFVGLPDFARAFDRVAHGDKRGEIVVRGWPDGEVRARFSAANASGALRDCAVRFSSDGKYLAAALEYPTMCDLAVWDLERRRVERKVRGGAHAQALDFTPNGRCLAAGRADGVIVLYEMGANEPTSRLWTEVVPHALRFAPQGSALAVSGGKLVKLLDYKSGDKLQALEHPDLVRGVAWSPDGALLATACANRCIYLWDSRDGRLQGRLEGRQAEAVHVAFNHRGNLLASHDRDGWTQIWDVRSGAALARVPGLAIAFDAEDGQLAFGGAEIGTWRVAGGLERRTLQAPAKERLWSAGIDPESRIAALARQDGVQLCDLATGAELGALDIGPVRLASFAPDASSLITWGSAGLLRWPLRRPPGSDHRKADELILGPPESLGLPASDEPEFAAVSADGRTFAAADRSPGELYVYDLAERRLLFRGPHADASRLAISPNGAWLAGGAGSDSHSAARLWDVRRQAQVETWPSSDDAAPAFSPDGRWLWLGSHGEGRLLAVGNWQLVCSTPFSGGTGGAAIFSPDSSLLAVNSSADRLQLLDPRTGREIAALETGVALCFNRPGNLLLTQSEDQTVCLWDLAAIRRGLAELDLDWSSAPLRPSRLGAAQTARMRIRVVSQANCD